MKKELLTIQEALARGKSLPYALLRSYSSVTMGPNPGEELSIGELLEARFFSEEEEIRIFRRDRSLSAVVLRDEEGDTTLTETYRVENRRLGNEVTVRRYLAWDDDGQAFIAAARLAGWKGGNRDG